MSDRPSKPGAPQPRPIRTRTQPGRLAALDRYLVHCERALLERRDGPWGAASVVDVGFGEHPWTTLEMARALRAINPKLCVVGVEIDAARVEAALEHAADKTDFVVGGFDLEAVLEGPARLVRAMNVLRQYDEHEVPGAHAAWGSPLLEGGLLVEGTASPEGEVLTAHLLRRRGGGLVAEGLLMFTDFRRGFAPWMFRDWLPRDLRRTVDLGTPLYEFFDAWTSVWQEVRAEGAQEPAQAFAESSRRLATLRADVVDDAWQQENGYLVLTPQRSP